MDRHDVPEMITAEIVADMHQQDLKVQHNFGCRGLTYWFDDKRKTAFCLIEAPDEKAVINMHDHAHGEVPHRIIEVDSAIVESFLGRIEDPAKSQNTRLNIINDPAFRTIMSVVYQKNTTKKKYALQSELQMKEHSLSIHNTIVDFDGRVVRQKEDAILASFKSVTQAILSALAIQTKIKMENKIPILKISLSAGIPVTEKESIFEDTIQLAERMNFVSNAEIVVSSEVRELYESENANQFLDAIFALSHSDENFLNSLINFVESKWTNPNLKVEDFYKELGLSKSQMYRKMMFLIGESPNSFLMAYRLNKALELLKKGNTSISEIAFDSGFNSPSYFAKSFQKKYNFSPSDFLRKTN